VNLRAFRAAVVLAWLVPLVARAQTAPDDAVAAEALFTAGRADVEHGDYAAACPKFAESQRLDPAPGTMINLADCEEHLGHLARAWLLWREALERLPGDDERRPVVATRVETIDKRVPRLTVILAPAAKTATDVRILRDDTDVPVRHLGVAVPVDPGEHVLLVDARGFGPSRYVVNVPEGARQTVVLDVGPPEARPAEAAPVRPPESDTTHGPSPFMRYLGWGLLGTGVVGLGTSGITGLAAIGRKHAQERNCYPIDACNSDGAAAASDGRTLATVSTISFVVGVAAIAAGVYFVVRSGSR